MTRIPPARIVLRLTCLAALILTLAALAAPPVGTAFADEDVATIRTGADTAVDESDGLDTSAEPLRDSIGRVSGLNTDKANPYKGQLRLLIDVGSEFADYTVGLDSEGYIIKCSPGDILRLPVVQARPGYIFIGWCRGGVPEEPAWDIMIRNVEITEDIGKEARIYAVYADEAGNGYCTCGAYKEGVYADRLDEFRAAYRDYLSAYSYDQVIGSSFGLAAVALVFVVVMFVVFVLTRGRGRILAGSAKRGKHAAAAKSSSPTHAGTSSPAVQEPQAVQAAEPDDARSPESGSGEGASEKYDPGKDPLDIMLG